LRARPTIADAITQGQLRLDYQPKLDVRGNAITSAEALIRWQHPDDGLRMPDTFIGESEDSGSIAALTLWTIDTAINDQQTMAAVGVILRIFINLSAKLLTDDAIVDHLCDRLGHHSANIGIEITERSVIADPVHAFANIGRLRRAGYAIAIDDYGSGLSSLTYLKQIEADELKIDKSFIIALGSSHRDPLIVRSTIDLAHALGMVVTAEGVETPAAHALLTVMGCDMVQGYLIGRPMQRDDFVTYHQSFDGQRLIVPRDQRVFTDRSFWKHAI
jgi:diguanylate cyclase